MVAVAQLAERLVVVQEVAGSSPVSHPTHECPPPQQKAAAGIRRTSPLGDHLEAPCPHFAHNIRERRATHIVKRQRHCIQVVREQVRVGVQRHRR